MSIIQEVLIWKVMICTGIGLFGFIIFGSSTFFVKFGVREDRSWEKQNNKIKNNKYI